MMSRRASDDKKQPLPSSWSLPHPEAYDEAENLHLRRDQQAWGKLSAFHERFVLLPWDNPPAERIEDIDSGRGRQFPKRG
jgi:hypothetical protein